MNGIMKIGMSMNKLSIMTPVLVSVSLLFLLSGCASIEQATTVKTTPNVKQSLQIPGLKHCSNTEDNTLNIDPNTPLTVIVHGCFSSAGKFRALSEVYDLNDQQAICFEYDDRDSLETSSGELVYALNQLSKYNPNQPLHVIGHSQGGLVARRALTLDREDKQIIHSEQIKLTTVSSPFNGINASSHCGITSLRILSLGIVDLICYAVTGEKYQQIPPNVDFMTTPGELSPSVSQHLIIKTDERNQCRRMSENQRCLEDDYVFSLEEQSNTAVDAFSEVIPITVEIGHVKIVGNEVFTPTTLINILKEQQLLLTKDGISDSEQARLIDDIYKNHQASQ